MKNFIDPRFYYDQITYEKYKKHKFLYTQKKKQVN